MIEETAVVVEIRDQQALLQTQRKSACQSCSVKSACGTSVLSRWVGQRSAQFIVENTLQAKPGQQVIIAVDENALVQGSFLVYFLPLVSMLLAGVLAEWLFSSELLTILFSLAGFILSVILVRYTLPQSRLKKSIQPHMLRRVT